MTFVDFEELRAIIQVHARTVASYRVLRGHQTELMPGEGLAIAAIPLDSGCEANQVASHGAGDVLNGR